MTERTVTEMRNDLEAISEKISDSGWDIYNLTIMQVRDGYWVIFQPDSYDLPSEQHFYSYKELEQSLKSKSSAPPADIGP